MEYIRCAPGRGPGVAATVIPAIISLHICCHADSGVVALDGVKTIAGSIKAGGRVKPAGHETCHPEIRELRSDANLDRAASGVVAPDGERMPGVVRTLQVRRTCGSGTEDGINGYGGVREDHVYWMIILASQYSQIP